MKRICMVVLAAVLSIPFWTLCVMAEEAKPSATASVGAFSKYIWRGYEQSDDSVVIQPSIGVGYQGFTMTLWGNLDTDRDDRDPSVPNQSQWTETDLTLDYSRAFGPVKLSAGYIYYAMDGADDTQELYLGASLNVFLNPTLTLYREIAHLQGWYIRAGISHSFELGGGIGLDLGGGVGYYYSDDDAFVEYDDGLNPTTERYRGFHDGTLSAGLKIPLGKYFVVNPVLAYSFPLSDSADNAIEAGSFSGRSDFLYGGVNLTLSF